MNKDFEIKKLKLELLRVTTAKAELDFKIEERHEEIKRLSEHILIQEKREVELKAEISKLQGN